MGCYGVVSHRISEMGLSRLKATGRTLAVVFLATTLRESGAAAAPPQPEIRVETDVLIGGIPTDLVCDAVLPDAGAEVVVVGEPESAPEELRELGRLLASRGYAAVIPRLERALPADGAIALASVVKSFEATILARGADVPCAGLRHCHVMSGSVGGPMRCLDWSASRPRRFVVLGAGVLGYLEFLRTTGCDREYGGGTFIDPDTRGVRVPALRCEYATVIHAPVGLCHDGFSDLQSVPLEQTSMTILTVPNAGHCDAVFGGVACASRCGAPRSPARTAFLWDKVIESLSHYGGGVPDIDTPELKRTTKGTGPAASPAFSPPPFTHYVLAALWLMITIVTRNRRVARLIAAYLGAVVALTHVGAIVGGLLDQGSSSIGLPSVHGFLIGMAAGLLLGAAAGKVVARHSVLFWSVQIGAVLFLALLPLF